MSARTLPDSVPPAAFSHYVLRTAHPKDSAAFYSDLLGMHANRSGENGAVLSHDGEHHRIALMGVQDAPRTPGPGLEHVAWRASSLGDLLGNHAHMKARGYEHYVAIHHGGTISIYYRDPDKNQTEIYIDVLTVDESIAYMDSPVFKQNPVGTPFDVDELTRRYEAGEPMESLLARPEATSDEVDDMMAKVIAGMTGD